MSANNLSYRARRDELMIEISELKLKRAKLLNETAEVSLLIAQRDVELGAMTLENIVARVKENNHASS